MYKIWRGIQTVLTKQATEEEKNRMLNIYYFLFYYNGDNNSITNKFEMEYNCFCLWNEDQIKAIIQAG